MDAGILTITSLVFSALAFVYGITRTEKTNAFMEVPTGKE